MSSTWKQPLSVISGLLLLGWAVTAEAQAPAQPPPDAPAGAPGATPPARPADPLAAAEALLSSPQPAVRRQGVRQLAVLPGPAATRRLLRVLATDPAVAVRRAALLVLSRRLTRAQAGLLRGRVATEPDPGLRRMLSALLTRLALGPPKPPLPLEQPPPSDRRWDAPAAPRKPKGRQVRFFLGLEFGLGWWHHFDPPVVGSAFGRVGLRYKWFEFAVGFGSPAWAAWRSRGLYEFFVDLGFYSLRRGWLRLRHQARLGLLCHNPPFELHELGWVVHLDFASVGFHLGAGWWAEVSPLIIAVAPRDIFSTSAGLRYEF